ncbi:MAG TPA: hypothetical protein VKZ54_05985 [Membranihabitans sp.]|nr:hypothetical protein [Membranihabitans sp.]
MATCYIENTRYGYGEACQPSRKTYPPLRVPSPSVRTSPGKLEFRSVMVPHRSHMGTIVPVKKIDETPIVIFANEHFSLHIEPHTQTSRVKYFLFVKNTTLFVVYNA